MARERETWFVLEDGSSADPREVAADDKGALRHKGGAAVAMRGDVPRSRGVYVDRAMKPAAPAAGYATRDMAADDAARPADDMADLRAAYRAKFGKVAFHGWDAATLREKLAAAE